MNTAKVENPCTSVQNFLEENRTYTIQGKTFIVEPVFKKESKDTVGSIIMRLMQAER